MKTLEYKYVDKTEWERGEWDAEPDKVQFQDEATGMPCLIVRNGSGALCGYVGVNPGHPFYEQGYDTCILKNDDDKYINVHGGLTFSGFCREDAENHGICHLPDDGEEKKVWWLGFDCAHSGDISPRTIRQYREWGLQIGGESYRDLNYVKHEVSHLARQIANPETCEVYTPT